MQRLLNITMKVKCNKEDLLKKLIENRTSHISIVKEAKIGYIKKAQKVLEEKLEEVKSGSLERIYIELNLPEDHTSEYDVIIDMLQMHTEETIELNADEVRMFVQDKWNWTEQFLISNSGYSRTAYSLINAKG